MEYIKEYWFIISGIIIPIATFFIGKQHNKILKFKSGAGETAELKACKSCGKSISASDLRKNKMICPECGTREALDAAGVEKAEQDKIIAEMDHQTF